MRPHTAHGTRPSADAARIGIAAAAACRRVGRPAVDGPAVDGVPDVPPVGPPRSVAPLCLANRRCATEHLCMCAFISDWRWSTPHAGHGTIIISIFAVHLGTWKRSALAKKFLPQDGHGCEGGGMS